MRSHNLQGEREAEIICQALDRHLGSIETRKPNIAAWEAEKAFINQVKQRSPLPGGRDWRPQIMGEFFIATTRANRPLLAPREAIARMRNYLVACEVVDVTGLITHRSAAKEVETHHFQFWVAQIWATARLNQRAHLAVGGAELKPAVRCSEVLGRLFSKHFSQSIQNCFLNACTDLTKPSRQSSFVNSPNLI